MQMFCSKILRELLLESGYLMFPKMYQPLERIPAMATSISGFELKIAGRKFEKGRFHADSLTSPKQNGCRKLLIRRGT